MLMVLRPARLNPYAFINVFLRVAGYFYNMTNDNQHHVLEKGKSAVLECEFHADSYNLFNNPVLWTKIQLNERTPVNLLGNLNEPFASTNRFEVSFTASPPRYRFELSVLDVTPEDSGNYTCEVKASNFLILASMIHFLYVRDDVKNLFVVRGNEVPFDHRLNSSVIKVIEGKPVRLTCISFGGYPPPKLELSLGKQDITALFEFRSSAVLTGSRGMRKVTFKNERWMNNMRFEAAENGNVLKCISTVPGYEPRHYEAHLEVQYAPRVTCLDAIVAVDNDDVVLRCNVTSRPPPTTLVWILNNETNLTQHSRHLPNAFVTNRDFGNGIMQTSLVVRSVSSDDVRKYSVIVGNDVAETTNQVEIRRKSKIQIDGNVLVSDSMSYHVTNNNNFNKKLNELLKGKKAARTRPSSDHHHHHHHHIHHRHKDEQQHGPSAQQLNSAGSNFSFLHLVVVVATLLFFVKMLTMTKNHLSL